MKIKIKQNYRTRRKQEYPDIGEQLDAIWKIVGALPGKKDADVQDILDRVNAVKARYPKRT
jgi:hypothetical protein